MIVRVRTRRLRGDRVLRTEEIERRARRMLKALDLPRAELSILLCDDETIRELNRVYRKKDRPTDVLSFSMLEGEAADVQPTVLGDIVISVETVRRQARSENETILAHATMLLAHGLLHLLGFDHRTDAEERRMKAHTATLCAAAGEGVPRQRRREELRSREKRSPR